MASYAKRIATGGGMLWVAAPSVLLLRASDWPRSRGAGTAPSERTPAGANRSRHRSLGHRCIVIELHRRGAGERERDGPWARGRLSDHHCDHDANGCPSSPGISSMMFALAGAGAACVPWLVGFESTQQASLKAGLGVALGACVVMLGLYLQRWPAVASAPSAESPQQPANLVN